MTLPKNIARIIFIVIDQLGTSFIPTLFALKRKVDLIAGRFKFMPDKFSDRLMQFLSKFWAEPFTSSYGKLS